MLKFKEGVAVIRVNQDGILVDTTTGRYLAINPIACEMIEALNAVDTEQEAIVLLQRTIHATEETLQEGLNILKSRLDELELVITF